ncbi:TolC family protein [Verrucomicrobia bacterium]|nr:TolC family protein [Verrucomicrobiota bacterium]
MDSSNTRHRINQPPAASQWSLLLLLGTALAILAGCSTAHHRKKADEEAYAIIAEVEKHVFGKASDFTIDTRYSHRDPEDILSPEIIEERQEIGAIKINLPEALKMAAENDRNFQTQRENLYLKALTLSERRYAFSPQFLGTTDQTLTRESDGDVKGDIDSRVQVSKFMKSGGRLSGAIANDLLRYFTGNPRREAVNILTLNFSQPLLRGRGREVAAESLTQAEREVIYEIRKFTQFQRDFAADVVSSYFSLLQSKDSIRNNYRNLQSRKKNRERAEAQLKARDGFLGSPKDRDLAVQSELNSRNSYITGIGSYEGAINRFAQNTLNLPIGTKIFLDDSTFDELEKVGLLPVDITLEEGYELALEHFLPLISDIDRFEDSKRKIGVAASQLKTGLNFSSSASLNWDKEENYVQFDVEQFTANAGLEIDLPFNRHSERNSYRQATIAFERGIRNLALALDSKRSEIDDGLRSLNTQRESYKIELLGVTVAERRVMEQEARAEAGNVDQQTLIDAQDELISKQNSKTKAIVDYLNLRLDLLLALGTIDTTVDRFWLKTPELVRGDQPAFISTDMSKLLSEELPAPEQIFAEPAL